MWLVHAGCIWCFWTLSLSQPLAFTALPSPGSTFIGLATGISCSVWALVSFQSFLFLNLILEISYILILHLSMALKCVLLALIPLNRHSLYIWMTQRHLQLLIFKTCIHLLSSGHPTADTFLSLLKAPKPFLPSLTATPLIRGFILQGSDNRDHGAEFKDCSYWGGLEEQQLLAPSGPSGAGNPSCWLLSCTWAALLLGAKDFISTFLLPDCLDPRTSGIHDLSRRLNQLSH